MVIPATQQSVGYFSMEIALERGIPTYSGGLGVLAGDTLRSAADLRVPMVAMTLLHRRGYFYQRLDANGWQQEEPVEWVVEDFLEEMPERVAVVVEGRTVHVRAWKHQVVGISGSVVPVYLLDTDLPENAEWDRTLTHYLYGGDQHYRLCQEVILGIGGVKMLRALGYGGIRRFHMNEGHASLLTLALLDEEAQTRGQESFSRDDLEAVREQCVFTTHTPVAAGHDKFPLELAERVIGVPQMREMEDVFCHEGLLNMTYLALNLSDYVNGVAKKHRDISRLMFAHHEIDAITNGVHLATWASRPFQELFDRRIPGWREDNFSLRYALGIPLAEIWEAHSAAKRELILRVNRETNLGMDVDLFTIGFARRAATYKRADLLFRDAERLAQIAARAGAIQVVYAGKAHPQDQGGKEIIKRIIDAAGALRRQIKVAYLSQYDLALGGLMTAGVDIWLNTPLPPLEASGTSGMKAALNGVPSLSTLDGWWLEGHIEGVTGWSIGGSEEGSSADDRSHQDARSLCDKLEHVVIPLFYQHRDGFIQVMRQAVGLNGSFFNTHRMVQQYVTNAYFQ